METVSHSQILMWTVTFFFGGMGVYGAIFWFIVKGLKSSVTGLRLEVKAMEVNRIRGVDATDKQLKILEDKKLDILIYVDDRKAANMLLSKLQTIDMCGVIRHGCGNHIIERLEALQVSVDKINDRLDKHINGQ